MNKKLYHLMDWAEIEAVTYSEEDHPKSILGPHEHGLSTLIQVFRPHARSVSIRVPGMKAETEMELVDEEGYFACLVRKKYPFDYFVEEVSKDGVKSSFRDPYSFGSGITKKDLTRFSAGTHYRAYEMLGAHVTKLEGVDGVHFALWAPNAIRASVVGDFNGWDGRVHQMERIEDSDIFELFVPDVAPGSLYKFEMKTRSGMLVLKADPYAYLSEPRPKTASVVSDISDFDWSDEEWMKYSKKRDFDRKPLSIYELHLPSWPGAVLEGEEDEDGAPYFANYRELAVPIAKYLKSVGYNALELLPVMEHPLDQSYGFQTTGYFAPTSRFGSPEDFAWFVDHLHREGIAVFLDWNPSSFPRDPHALALFDGGAAYENEDSRRSFLPDGTLNFDLGRGEVKSFLLSSAFFWASMYHADGVNSCNTAAILYYDYCRAGTEWIPNLYGGSENLDAIAFFRELSAVMHKIPHAPLLIAEENSAFPGVTGETADGTLGFDLKWNNNWARDYLTYMAYDPLYRTHHYAELVFSLIYAWSEKFILPFSHSEVLDGKGDILDRMSGTEEEKQANLKASFGFLMTHPGKKLIFMGQDEGEGAADREGKALTHKCLCDLMKLYLSYPALYEEDFSEEGFEWINCISANENIIVFCRKTKRKEDTLLVVLNFENIPRKNYKIGVPFAGSYKEIFNSDAEIYGGFDFRNPRARQSVKDECDGREDSLRIKVPPLAISIFSVTPA